MTPEPRRRWNDDRIDDLAKKVDAARGEAQKNHDKMEAKVDAILKSRLTPLQIIIGTSPITAALIAVLGALILGGKS